MTTPSLSPVNDDIALTITEGATSYSAIVLLAMHDPLVLIRPGAADAGAWAGFSADESGADVLPVSGLSGGIPTQNTEAEWLAHLLADFGAGLGVARLEQAMARLMAKESGT